MSMFVTALGTPCLRWENMTSQKLSSNLLNVFLKQMAQFPEIGLLFSKNSGVIFLQRHREIFRGD